MNEEVGGRERKGRMRGKKRLERERLKRGR